MNFFGRFATVDIAPGGAPTLPRWLRRFGRLGRGEEDQHRRPLGDVVEAVGDGAGDEDHAAGPPAGPGRPPQPGPASRTR